VVATRDRLPTLLPTLDRLRTLPEQPRIIVVDNGSSDRTVEMVRRRFPELDAFALPENLGGAARTVGLRRVATPYVAFSDDDSWWADGALARAADVLDAYPRLAVLAARVLVGPDERVDPTCLEMAASPLRPERPLPGPPVLGFIACGVVVRRSAYLAVGGFERRFGIGGEEELLAIDLAAAGWALAYVDDIVAHHHPSPVRDPAGRRRVVTRNALWCAWLRRPLSVAAVRSTRLLRATWRDPAARAGLAEALQSLPWVVRARRVIPAEVEAGIRTLERRSSPLGAPPRRQVVHFG
jgi:GT2 family glycosyltransferase